MIHGDAFPGISLFSGAPGLDLGLERAGFRPRAFVEVDPVCQETIRANLPKMGWIEPSPVSVMDDITPLSSEEILAKSCLDVGEVVLLAGGSPVGLSARPGGGSLWATREVDS